MQAFESKVITKGLFYVSDKAVTKTSIESQYKEQQGLEGVMHLFNKKNQLYSFKSEETLE